MAVFVYQGRSANGMQNGEIEASDRSAAVGELRRRAILVTKILSEMEREDHKLGLVSLCIGGGQGIAMLIERD